MTYETDDQKRAIQRWCRLAIQLNGLVDAGRHGHLSVAVVVEAAKRGEVFALLEAELPPQVWEIAKLTDVDRHRLSSTWTTAAQAFDPIQYHVANNGLSLLVAYLLHLIDVSHAVIPM